MDAAALTDNEIDAKGNTLIHRIASKGGVDAVEMLQAVKASYGFDNLNAQNNFGQTAAMIAAQEMRWDVVEYLVGEGADIIHKGIDGGQRSVWDCCMNKSKGEAALARGYKNQRQLWNTKQLRVPQIRHRNDLLQETLFKVALAGDLEFVEGLLRDRKVPIYCVDKEGNNVLHHLAKVDLRLNVAEYILQDKKGRRLLHQQNNFHDTPAHLAARGRAWKMLKAYIQYGASVSVKDDKQTTVFSYAQVNQAGKDAVNEGLEAKKKFLRESLDEVNLDLVSPRKRKEFNRFALEPLHRYHYAKAGPQASSNEEAKKGEQNRKAARRFSTKHGTVDAIDEFQIRALLKQREAYEDMLGKASSRRSKTPGKKSGGGGSGSSGKSKSNKKSARRSKSMKRSASSPKKSSDPMDEFF